MTQHNDNQDNTDTADDRTDVEKIDEWIRKAELDENTTVEFGGGLVRTITVFE